MHRRDAIRLAAGLLAKSAAEVLQPELPWEGADLPLEYSFGGRSRQWERGLRDPAVYREGNRAWLLNSSTGEHGLGMARLKYRA